MFDGDLETTNFIEHCQNISRWNVEVKHMTDDPFDQAKKWDENEAVRRQAHDFFAEEAEELKAAIKNNDITDIADGIGDVIFTAVAAGLKAGFTPEHINQIISDVNKSNFTKFDPETGKPIFRSSDGKVMKGSAFQPPKFDFLLT